jgi:hypothetical protein
VHLGAQRRAVRRESSHRTSSSTLPAEFPPTFAQGYEVTAAINAWNDELSLYDYNAPGYSHETGHFTQDVWKATTKLGCGLSDCPAGKNFVCEYDPAGELARVLEDPTVCLPVPLGNVLGPNGDTKYFVDNVPCVRCVPSGEPSIEAVQSSALVSNRGPRGLFEAGRDSVLMAAERAHTGFHAVFTQLSACITTCLRSHKKASPLERQAELLDLDLAAARVASALPRKLDDAILGVDHGVALGALSACGAGDVGAGMAEGVTTGPEDGDLDVVGQARATGPAGDAGIGGRVGGVVDAEMDVR